MGLREEKGKLGLIGFKGSRGGCGGTEAVVMGSRRRGTRVVARPEATMMGSGVQVVVE